MFDVKADGWLNVLHALGDAAPGTAIVFSSIAGRFGNAGQTDYSAANDLLCKSVSNMRRRSGGTRGIAIDWTAWASIGMASRGSIPKMMEVAGIDMLPPEIGVPAVRRELTASGAGGEVLVAGSLGVLLEERHPSGGLDAERATEALAERSGPMTGRIAELTLGGGLTRGDRARPEPAGLPVRPPHRGHPRAPRRDGHGGLRRGRRRAAARLEGRGTRGRRAARAVQVLPRRAAHARAAGAGARRRRRHARGRLPADRPAHAARPGRAGDAPLRGRARLAREAPAAPQAAPPADAGDDGVGREVVYGVYFHGPAYQVLDRVWRDDGHVVGRLAGELPADHEPETQPTEFVPRLIELCFQTAGVWELGTAGRMALPTHVERVVRFAGADAPGRLWAVVRPREGDGGVDAEVVDEAGRVRVRLEGYRTIELPGGLDAEALAPIRTAMGSG